jgi:hypothetical protein
MRQYKPSSGREATRNARTLMFLADLFERAASVVIVAKHLGHPITIAAALFECLKGKLLRDEITAGDMQTVPVLLRWVGSEMQRYGC